MWRDASWRLTTKVSDSHWQRTRDCNHSDLSPVKVATAALSGCSLHPLVRHRSHRAGESICLQRLLSYDTGNGSLMLTSELGTCVMYSLERPSVVWRLRTKW